MKTFESVLPKLDRVLVDGVGTTLRSATYLDPKYSVDVIFVRDDGWTIGCAYDYIEPTKKLWPESWSKMLIRPG